MEQILTSSISEAVIFNNRNTGVRKTNILREETHLTERRCYCGKFRLIIVDKYYIFQEGDDDKIKSPRSVSKRH